MEVVNAIFVGKVKKIPTPCLSKVTKMRVKQPLVKVHELDLGLESFYKGQAKLCR